MKGKKRMVRSFITHVLELLRFGTIKDTANHVGLGWDAVKELHKEALEKKYDTVPISDMEYIGMDEFSIRKGHKYMTIFTDLKTGRIVHAVEGRKEEDIEAFLKQLKKKPIY
jgi:transposase